MRNLSLFIIVFITILISSCEKIDQSEETSAAIQGEWRQIRYYQNGISISSMVYGFKQFWIFSALDGTKGEVQLKYSKVTNNTVGGGYNYSIPSRYAILEDGAKISVYEANNQVQYIITERTNEVMTLERTVNNVKLKYILEKK